MGFFNCCTRLSLRRQAYSSKMVQRLTYRRRLSYNTQSNRRKISKTPGGRLVYLHQKKLGSIPKCGDTKKTLFGIKPARPRELSSMCKRKKHVPEPMVVSSALPLSEAELSALSWSRN